MDTKRKKDILNGLQKFRTGQLEKFKKTVIDLVEKLHWRKLKKFKDSWDIPKKGFQNSKKLEDWYKEVQIKHPEKKYDVIFIEVEEFHIIEENKIVDTAYSVLFEENPRVVNLGNLPEIVFDHEVKTFMNELNLDPDWATLFKQYLLFGRESIEAVRVPSVVVTERITYGKKLQQLEHRIALNISPNTPIDEIQLLWKPIVAKLQNKIKGSWLYKRRKSKLQPLLERLINLDIEDQKRGIHRSDYKKAEILFGELDKDPKYRDLEPKKIGEIENKRVKLIVNLRRHYKKLLLSQ